MILKLEVFLYYCIFKKKLYKDWQNRSNLDINFASITATDLENFMLKYAQGKFYAPNSLR